MKTLRAFNSILLCLVANEFFSQFSFAWRAEVQDNYCTLNDPGKQMQNTVAKTGAIGFDIIYNRKNWLLSSGICNKSFSTLITFSNLNASTPQPLALQVPVLLGRKFSFFKNKINICPLIGTNFIYLPIVRSFPHDFFAVTDTIIFSVNRSALQLKKTAFTLGGMLQLNIQISKHYSLGTYIAYSKGFKTIVQQNVNYGSGSAVPTRATRSDNATFFSRWAIRLQYNI